MPVSTIERLMAPVGDLIGYGDEKWGSTMKLSLLHRYSPV